MDCGFTGSSEGNIFGCRPHCDVSCEAAFRKRNQKFGRFETFEFRILVVLSTRSLRNSICSIVFMMHKYSHLESPVDSFVFQLLCHLGFNDNWLYISPQLHLKLRSNERSIMSKADFTLMDITSFYRVVVVEDKKTDEYMISGAEAQF